MEILTKAANFIKRKQIKIIGINLKQIIIKVGYGKNHQVVTLKKKAGRVLDSCSCQNHSRFCKENPRCSHKIAACTFLCIKRIKWK